MDLVGDVVGRNVYWDVFDFYSILLFCFAFFIRLDGGASKAKQGGGNHFCWVEAN